MSNNKQTKEYKYPKGDFLSGFSDDINNPCDYELECQRMVIMGVQYLDRNPKVFEIITKEKPNVFHFSLKDMIDFMMEGEYGHTGAMVSHSLTHAYHAKRIGWDNYIKKITENNEQQ